MRVLNTNTTYHHVVDISGSSDNAFNAKDLVAFLLNPGGLRRGACRTTKLYQDARDEELALLCKRSRKNFGERLTMEDLERVKHQDRRTRWEGATPMHLAAYYRSAEVLEYILENSPEARTTLNLKDANGHTVLNWAEARPRGNNKDGILTLLRKYGATERGTPVPTHSVSPRSLTPNLPRGSIARKTRLTTHAGSADHKTSTTTAKNRHTVGKNHKKGSAGGMQRTASSNADASPGSRKKRSILNDEHARVRVSPRTARTDKSESSKTDPLKHESSCEQLHAHCIELVCPQEHLPGRANLDLASDRAPDKPAPQDASQAPGEKLAQRIDSPTPTPRSQALSACDEEMSEMANYRDKYLCMKADIESDKDITNYSRVALLNSLQGYIAICDTLKKNTLNIEASTPEHLEEICDGLKAGNLKLSAGLRELRRQYNEAYNPVLAPPQLSLRPGQSAAHLTPSQPGIVRRTLTRLTHISDIARSSRAEASTPIQMLKDCTEARKKQIGYGLTLNALQRELEKLDIASGQRKTLLAKIHAAEEAIRCPEAESIMQRGTSEQRETLHKHLCELNIVLKDVTAHVEHQYSLLRELAQARSDDKALHDAMENLTSEIETHFGQANGALTASTRAPLGTFVQTRTNLSLLADQPITRILSREQIAKIGTAYVNWRTASAQGNQSLGRVAQLRGELLTRMEAVIPSRGTLRNDPAMHSHMTLMGACEKPIAQISGAAQRMCAARSALESMALTGPSFITEALRLHPIYKGPIQLLASLDQVLASKVLAIRQAITTTDRNLALEALSTASENGCRELEELTDSLTRLAGYLKIKIDTEHSPEEPGTQDLQIHPV